LLNNMKVINIVNITPAYKLWLESVKGYLVFDTPTPHKIIHKEKEVKND